MYLIITKMFALLFVYQIKHYLADYPLQNSYMLQKFRREGWFIPLAAHAGVHAAFTALIVFVCGKSLQLVGAAALFDFGIHFIMDRIKASPDILGAYKSLDGKCYMEAVAATKHQYIRIRQEAKEALRGNTLFWWALGFDQMIHHLTHYIIIMAIVVGK